MRDQELVERAQDGDRAAFEILVEQYRASAFSTAYALLGNAHDAEDATQEALTVAWLRLADLLQTDRFAGWLYRITQNCCRNLLRRSRAYTVPIEDASWRIEVPGAPDVGVAVREALSQLSEPLGHTATLFYLDGYTVQEVGARLGIPVGTAERRLHDARRQLRDLLSGHRRYKAKKGERIMRLFTGKGDRGTTDLPEGRVPKDAPQVAILGTFDEMTSTIGLGRAMATSTHTKELLVEVQRDLYRIAASVAFGRAQRPAEYTIGADRVARLETLIDDLADQLQIPPQFILPGDSVSGAVLDVARTVARRAEREAVALAESGTLADPQVLPYLNRLSSFLFVLARFEDREAGVVPLLARTPTV